MTAALCCLAAALLAWPEPGWRRRARLGRSRRRAATGRGLHLESRAAPLLAAGGAGAAAASVSTPLVAALVAGAAALAARAWTARREGARADARLLALTEALGALAAELRSGRPLDAAVAAAARSGGDEELGRALVRTVRDPAGGTASPPVATRAGPVEEALGRLVSAVRLSARTGAALSEVVTAVEDDLRARQRHRLELRAAVAAPRASAALLAGLPGVGLAMGSGVGADPWGVLTQTGAGQGLLVVGVGLEAAGVAWSRRLVARATRPAPVPR